MIEIFAIKSATNRFESSALNFPVSMTDEVKLADTTQWLQSFLQDGEVEPSARPN